MAAEHRGFLKAIAAVHLQTPAEDEPEGAKVLWRALDVEGFPNIGSCKNLFIPAQVMRALAEVYHFGAPK